MRIALPLSLAFPTVLALAACSEAPPAPAPEAQAARPAALAPGQWQLTRTTTRITSLDDCAPALPFKPGDTETTSVCLAAADVAKPPATLLGGRAEHRCTTDNVYARNGRVNATLACSPPGLAGRMFVSTSGSFTADALDLTASAGTQLSGTGDVRLEETIAGIRTGACT